LNSTVKIVTIIGARPQFIKASALSRAIRNHFADRISEVIVHTGQHYDDNMSKVFFNELEIPDPHYNLGVGSASHGKQTGAMIEKIEEVLIKEKPDCVILYGDTNSTLAGAVAASKMQIPIAHIEAGMRSFNKTMPEEINRIVCDHVSALLFTPTRTGLNNLVREGFSTHNKLPFTSDNPGVFHCGDVMYDNSLYFSGKAEQVSGILENNRLGHGKFVLGTIHREGNTDDPARLTSIFKAFDLISEEHSIDVILPLHPRTSKVLQQNLEPVVYRRVVGNPRIKIIPPASFFDTMVLEKNCLMVMTDSGGIQKEAFFNKKPVLILRKETEWTEIVENKSGICTDADEERIIRAFHYFISNPVNFPPVFGDGKAAEFICKQILSV
jgi:UDP-GlcNAc3NAcA epimerase